MTLIQENKNMLIAADGHLHWYPGYRPEAAFNALLRNFDDMAGPCSDGRPVLNVGLLVEGARFDFFNRLKSGNIDCSAFDADILTAEDGRGLTFARRGTPLICLIAGRQVVTRERLEILGVGLQRQPDDGRPVFDTIRQVVENGGFPILPWSPGKWLFRRGALVRDIIERADGRELAIGDSSMRPRHWPPPSLMRLARARGLAIVPGSDPLPLPGEERIMGSYGFIYDGPFDPEHPVSSALRLLGGDPARIRPAGRRRSLPDVAGRLARLRSLKKQR